MLIHNSEPFAPFVALKKSELLTFVNSLGFDSPAPETISISVGMPASNIRGSKGQPFEHVGTVKKSGDIVEYTVG